jgi:hypothetical protein
MKDKTEQEEREEEERRRRRIEEEWKLSSSSISISITIKKERPKYNFNFGLNIGNQTFGSIPNNTDLPTICFGLKQKHLNLVATCTNMLLFVKFGVFCSILVL